MLRKQKGFWQSIKRATLTPKSCGDDIFSCSRLPIYSEAFLFDITGENRYLYLLFSYVFSVPLAIDTFYDKVFFAIVSVSTFTH